jgi:hypothetical protein
MQGVGLLGWLLCSPENSVLDLGERMSVIQQYSSIQLVVVRLSVARRWLYVMGRALPSMRRSGS